MAFKIIKTCEQCEQNCKKKVDASLYENAEIFSCRNYSPIKKNKQEKKTSKTGRIKNEK